MTLKCSTDWLIAQVNVLMIFFGIIMSDIGVSGDLALNSESELPDEYLEAIVPAPRNEPDWIQWWIPRHEALAAEVLRRPEAQILWFGDSITHLFETAGRNCWNEFYSPRQAINLGVLGDRTEHLRWRIAHTDFSQCRAKLAIVLIGTNNSGQRRDPAPKTIAGISAVLQDLKSVLPQTRILLLALLPTQYSSKDPHRLLNNEVNESIRHFADNKHVFFHDSSHLFINESGTLNVDRMPDGIHPSPSAYTLWAQDMDDKVTKLLVPRAPKPDMSVINNLLILTYPVSKGFNYNFAYSTDMNEWNSLGHFFTPDTILRLEFSQSELPSNAFFRLSPILDIQ
nr:hypothetical protein [Cytophagales bacterium]